MYISIAYIENPENLMDSVDQLMKEKLNECLLDPEHLTLQQIIGKGEHMYFYCCYI